MAGKLLSKDILEKQRREIGFKDPVIFEKAVYALNLHACLLEYYPNLIFKGGTAILLYSFPPVRFSIDIDILLEEKERKELEKSLKALIDNSNLFKSVEEDKRKSDIPKSHYKFYYNSKYTVVEQYVLLDIVFCDNPYHKLIKKNLNSLPLLILNEELQVRIPTPEGLFGDKMAAISPDTIGIPLNEKREMEFVKQVIDLGGLFNLIGNTEDIGKTFSGVAKIENKFRKSNHSEEKILGSIVDLAFKYSQFLLKGSKDTYQETEYLNNGLKRVRNHLASSYNTNDLKLTFAKIVYICRIIREKISTEIIKNVDYGRIKSKALEGKYKILERLKKTNPDAYFYWILGTVLD